MKVWSADTHYTFRLTNQRCG